MEDYKKLYIQISNAYYNIALERMKSEDWTEAIEYLKKSLRYSKYHTNARNLLGLLYYHFGEFGEAMLQWNISTSLQPDPSKNVAFKYIDEINGNKSKYEDYFDSIRKFNQTLQETIIGREDLAMQHLYKIIEKNPTYLKALLLLALLQTKAKLYNKAGNTLLKIKKLDKFNHLAAKLFDIVKKNTGREEIENAKYEKVFSIRKMSTDDVIVPNEVIKLSPGQTVKSLVCGFLIAILFFVFVVNPINKISGSNATYNRDIFKYANLVDEQNKKINELTEEINNLSENLNQTSNKLKAFEEKDANFTSQYTTLNKIISDFTSGKITAACEAYVNLDKEKVVDDTLLELLNTCKSYIEGLGAAEICKVGSQNWNGGNIAGAEKCYKLAIQINPNEPEYLYLLGRLYQRNGKTEEGNAIFDKIIGEFPASLYAKRAKTARGY